MREGSMKVFWRERRECTKASNIGEDLLEYILKGCTMLII